MQFSAILVLALAATGLALPGGTHNPGSSKSPPQGACKRGELSARCFSRFEMECKDDGTYIDMHTEIGQDAYRPVINCNQIAACNGRGSVNWRGNAANAYNAYVIGICRDNCHCEAA